MNAPLLKKLRLGFQALVLMSWLDQCTPSADSPWKVSIQVLFGSLRRSYQIATHLPLDSEVKDGKNWSCGAGVPLAARLMYRIALQVVPPFVDCSNEMLAPEVDAFRLF